VFDIHGGGLDLIFPHHENEIAQSRCAHGTSVMANYWMHNGFLQVEGQKMSKSLGNFTTIANELDTWGGSTLRFNMLKTHYGQPIDWRQDSLRESFRELSMWADKIGNVGSVVPVFSPTVVEALSDDLNTHKAITELRAMAKSDKYLELAANLGAFGISLSAEMLDGRKHKHLAVLPGNLDTKPSRDQIVRLVEDRLLARHQKNWAESDRLRDELDAMGIAIKDHKDGTTSWEVKR
jgi:cysteinyl-tRNA synthetase